MNIEKYAYRPPREQIKNLFCAARLSPEKGLTFAIEAVRLLRDKGYTLELRLAGGGPSEAALKGAIKLKVVDQVEFLGFLSEAEVISELQMSDLFVLPELRRRITSFRYGSYGNRCSSDSYQYCRD